MIVEQTGILCMLGFAEYSVNIISVFQEACIVLDKGNYFMFIMPFLFGARYSVVVRGNSSSRTIVLESTQSVTEIITLHPPGGKARPAHKAGNLAAICLPIV
jgi:hypothetical protein